MKKIFSFVFVLLLLASALLTSCNTEAPPSTPQPTPSPAQLTPTETPFAPNERTITKKVFSPHDFELTLSTDKSSYKSSSEVKAVVTVKNIGEDYIIPECEVFSDVKLEKFSDSPVCHADPFEFSHEFEDGNVFKKGDVITQSFQIPIVFFFESYSSNYNFSLTLFGSKVSFMRSVVFFDESDISFEELVKHTDQYLLEHFDVKKTENYKPYISKKDDMENCYEVDYHYCIGDYVITNTYSIVINYETWEVIKSHDFNYFSLNDFTVTPDMLMNAEEALLCKVNEFKVNRGDAPLTMDKAYFYIEVYREELTLVCELIVHDTNCEDPLDDHFHTMFTEVICERNKSDTSN